MNQITIQTQYPFNLICLENGFIALTPNQHFKCMIDGDTKLDMEGFSIGDTSYEYNTAYDYKSIPAMLVWLKSLSLEMPNFNAHFGF